MKSLLVRFGLMGLILFLFFSAYLYISYHFVHHTEDEALRINIAGRQRMLLRNISYRMMHIINIKEPSEKKGHIEGITNIMNQYEEALHDLKYGNPLKGLKPVPEHNRESIKRLDELIELWQKEQKPALLKIISLPYEKRSESCNICHSVIRERLPEIEGLVTSLESHYKEDIKAHDRQRLYLFLFLSGLFIAVLVYTKKRIVDPILSIKDATQQIARGDFDIKARATSSGEIKELADSINSMASSLKTTFNENLRQTEQLEIIKVFSETVNKSLSLEDVCLSGLDTILRLEDLSIERKGAIFLKEKMDGMEFLKLFCHRGFTEDFARLEANVPLGECLCGLCAIQGEVIISESALNDKRHTRNYPGMVEHGHIVLPLKAGDNLIGVLCFYLPPNMRPSEDETGLLISLSNVLAVAIQNALNFTRIEQLLREIENHEERLRAMINTLPDCIKVIDRDGRLIDINPAGLQIIKASSPEEVLGRSIIPMIEPEHREDFERTIQRIFNQRTTEYLHLKIRDLKGEVHYIEGRYMPLRNPAGETIGILSISRDITEYKRLESQLYHSQKMEAIGQLAGGIAHDFNNMLNAIIGFGSLIDMNLKEDNPNKSYIREILKAAERATHLTRGLLTFSRKQPVRFETIELNELIKGFEKILKRIIGEDIKLKTILSEEPLIIMADPGQIEQVLMNLATNARDAMPDGGTIEIMTSTIQIDEDFIKKHGYGKPGSYVLIRFSDTGMGMDEITLSKIFEPFFTTKPFGKGTGLGLAIVYGIVKQHDGYINVESSPGKGTTFNIYLPLTEEEKNETRTEAKEIPCGKGELILVAEDSEEVMNALREILTRFGYRIIEAKDGREAVEKFSSHKDDISLLLFDVMMPGINGLDAWEEIKKIRDNVKVLFMSGYTDDILIKKGLSQDKINLISKPLSPEELLKRLRDILNSH